MSTDPGAVLRELCGFLGVDYAEQMLRFHEHPHDQGRSRYRPITRGRRDWRTEMQQHDRRRFDAAAGRSLRAFGYELDERLLDDDALVFATDFRRRFEDSVRARGRALPSRW
jgi:hypothetical protein